jgi:RluA family pseudouridine synthase
VKKIELKQPSHNNSCPRIDNFLAQNLPPALQQPLSKAQIRKLIIAGAVFLNGHRTRNASSPVTAGSSVLVHLDTHKLGSSAPMKDPDFKVNASSILFEDSDLIIVNKPFGIPTQPTMDKTRNNIFTSLQEFLKNRDGHDYVGLHHRLDRDTSGLLLFTKDKRANKAVSELFQSREMQKTYMAWCTLEIRKYSEDDMFTIQNYLGKEPRSKLTKYKSVKSGGDAAETHVVISKIKNNQVKVICQPKTGRTHQIRVHLSEAGLPIIGDRMYGLDPESSLRLHLHAWRLEFPHPMTQASMLIEAPLPDDLPNW